VSPSTHSRLPALGPGGEFDRIRAIARVLGSRAGALGDDCGLLPDGAGTVVASTDVSVEGVHFRLDWLGLQEIGWRSAAAALSDLAAAAATPVGLLIALVVPARAGERELVAVMAGVGDAAESVGARVLGGDLSTGPAWSLAVTVLGRAGVPMSRTGARPGDGVWVTGVLGGARAALEAWRRGEEPAPAARAAFAHPEPRIEAGKWLAARAARAMLDLSDGLGGDAAHLAAASAVAVHLDLASVPVAPDAWAEAQRVDLPVQQFAAEGGEDYELLVALPPDFGPAQAEEFERDCRLPLTRIGGIERGAGVRAGLAGRALTLAGYQHFG
jgi:thiamine-monophosphate kinase